MIQLIFILLNIFFIESVLSIDNAAVLAVLVKNLPLSQQSKALKAGICGAFVFRGLSLLLAGLLAKLWVLKVFGGGYLLYLSYTYFTSRNTDEENKIYKQDSPLFKKAVSVIGPFWATVALVEVMDMAFSIDNIFAVTAISCNIYLVVSGVFLGIIAMRFIAALFTKLITRYPELLNSTYIVIAALGLKLIVTASFGGLTQENAITKLVNGEVFEITFSAAMMVIFFVPVFYQGLED